MSDIFRFSRHSSQQLATVDRRLRRVVQVALGFGIIDFRVLEGARTDQRQQELLDADPPLTTLGPGQSKHNTGEVSGRAYAHAVDLLPVSPVNWNDHERFSILAGVMLCAAKIVGVPIRWGGDWDRDTETTDESFRDYGHFELDL